MKKILIISTDAHLREVLGFSFSGWGYEVSLEDSLTHDINHIKMISPDVIIADVHSADESELKICRLLKDDFITAFIPIITLINKRQLREQLLNIKQGVDDYLIKPPDPLDLRVRIEMAIKRSNHSFHASPLTGLPGTRSIEETLKNRIDGNETFGFGYVDIGGFKYFNDVYGYIKGDRVIMHTAYMLYTFIRRYGTPNDFIGHIGGDDFAFITATSTYEGICRNFISTFDHIIPFHYTERDRKKGYITARTRTHELKKVPLMSISAAIALQDNSQRFSSVIEINEKVAEIKRYLKTLPGSNFMEDRRNSQNLFDAKASGYSAHKDRLASYRPLGQILLEKNLISDQQLDDALKIHWKKGVALGEILKELGLLRENELSEALCMQKRPPT